MTTEMMYNTPSPDRDAGKAVTILRCFAQAFSSTVGISIVLTLSILVAGCTGTAPQLGIENGRLRQCPATPNCVNSQIKDDKHFIEPIRMTVTPSEAKNQILNILKESDRSTIMEVEDHYIRAAFASRIFGFVDDVEFYFPATTTEALVIHVRSAARVGYSDLGVNRKRIEQIRSRLNAMNNA